MLKLVFKKQFDYKFIYRIICWHAAYYIFGKGKPLIAGVYITNACNSRCIMCDIWKNKEKHIYPRTAQERAIDVLSKTGCYYYSISGGEPTLLPDLPERLEYAARKIPYVHLVTNGFSVDSELARALGLSGVREISISIDGTEDFHNTIRGISDAYQRAWNALELLCAYIPRITIVVNSLLTPYNIDALRILSKRLRSFKKGVYQKFLPYSAHALFGKKDLNCFASFGKGAGISEIECFLDEAMQNPKTVNSQVFLRKAKSYFRGDRNIIPEQKYCLYPYYAIEFDFHGLAYPCFTGMDFKDGIQGDVGLLEQLQSKVYRGLQQRLRGCTLCNGSMPLCYYEPRLNFPLGNFVYGMINR